MAGEDTSATRSSRPRAPIALLWALIGIAVAIVPQARTGLAADALARCLSSESAIAALGLATGAALFKETGGKPERRRYAAAAFAIAAVFMATIGFALPSRISRNIVAFLWGLIESALLGQTAQRERWSTYLALFLTELSALVTLGGIGESASDVFALIAGQVILLVMLFALLKLRRRKPAPSNDLSKSPPIYDTARLTEREREVVERLSRNETQVEIAKALGVSPSTVSTYRSRALKKLGVDAIKVEPPQISTVHESSRTSLSQLVSPAASIAVASVLLYAVDLVTGHRQVVGILACAVVALVPQVHNAIIQSAAQETHCAEIAPSRLVLSLGAGLFARELLIWRGSFPMALVVLVCCLAAMSIPKFRTGTLCPPACLHTGTLLDSCIFSVALLLRQFPDNDITAIRVGVISVTSSGTGLFLAGAFVAFFIWLLSTRLLPAESEHEYADAERSERLLNYLLAKGLTRTQAQVALDISQGLTQPQISAKEHLSAGAINSARLVAYRKLAVNSRRDLTGLLDKEIP